MPIDSQQPIKIQLPRRKFFRRATQLGASLNLTSPVVSVLGSLGFLAGCEGPQLWDKVKTTVDRPGMALGHAMRDLSSAPQAGITKNSASFEIAKRCQVLVVGSGIAGLSAVWNLRRQGVKDIMLLDGPEFMGNAANYQFAAGQSVPTGAHYLPLPSPESQHVREILKAMGVYAGQLGAERPSYDEAVLVHAPAERLLRSEQWESSLIPQGGLSPPVLQQQQQFFELTKLLSNTVGDDGKRLFVVPIALASRDPKWMVLDQITFKAWLEQSQYTEPSLLWYLDYCCRDEFGAGLSQVSAWAGLHYFASRAGHASNAEDGAVLTWPDGLATVATFLARAIQGQRMAASALHLVRQSNSVQVLAFDHASKKQFGIQAQTVVMATPLTISARIDPEVRLAFPNWKEQLPSNAPWIVGNFKMHRRAAEKLGSGLSWDNVVYGSESLGFVNASHQLLRVDEFAAPTLTSYHAINGSPAAQARQWCASASTEQLLEVAGQDLVSAYGARFWRHVQAAHITVRAHGMPSPTPGFLNNSLLTQLRKPQGRVWYANADLSGYSVFEEAAWWGVQVVA
jgi:NAD(P)-binding Rossmann-like domain